MAEITKSFRPVKPGTKAAQAIALVSRKNGCTVDELYQLFPGWEKKNISGFIAVQKNVHGNIINRNGDRLTLGEPGSVPQRSRVVSSGVAKGAIKDTAKPADSGMTREEKKAAKRAARAAKRAAEAAKVSVGADVVSVGDEPKPDSEPTDGSEPADSTEA